MAISITSGSGVSVATDEIGGVQYQQIKLVDGNLDSTSPVGVKDNPLIVSVFNSNNIVSVSNTSATISVLNTSSTISVLNTVTAVSLLNTSGTISVLNTRTSVTVSGGVTLLSSVPLTITGTALVSGGVSLLSSVPISVNVLNSSATITVLNTRTSVTVSGTVTAIVSGGVTLLSSVPIAISGTILVSGGTTLLSSIPLAVKPGVKEYLGCTSTWIYSALTSNNMITVWTPAAGKRFNLTDITINTVSAATIYVTQDTAATLTLMRLSLMDRGGWVSNLQTPIIASQTNHALVVQTSNTGSSGYVTISGYES